MKQIIKVNKPKYNKIQMVQNKNATKYTYNNIQIPLNTNESKYKCKKLI